MDIPIANSTRETKPFLQKNQLTDAEKQELLLHVTTTLSYLRETIIGWSSLDGKNLLEPHCLKNYDLWAKSIMQQLAVGLDLDKTLTAKAMQGLTEFSLIPLDVSSDSRLRSFDTTEKIGLLSTILGAMLKATNGYDARSRFLLRRLAESIQLDISDTKTDGPERRKLGFDLQNAEERFTTNGLMTMETELSRDLDQVISQTDLATTSVVQKHDEKGKTARALATAGATILGGILIGITGGLAAPVIAAGLGTALGAIGITGGALAVATGLAADAVLVGTIFGVGGAGVVTDIVDRNLRSISDFSLLPLHPTLLGRHKLHVVIGVSGLYIPPHEILLSPNQPMMELGRFVREPWNVIGPQGESYALRWEAQTLFQLSRDIDNFITKFFTKSVMGALVQQTALGALSSAISFPLTLIKVANLIDNPWRQCMSLADKAAKVLADVLLQKPFGSRPVTLASYGIGSRVVLQALVEMEKRQGYGIVENVIVMGSPYPGHTAGEREKWLRIRRVVAGRVVNCYSTQDWLLAFVHRTTIVGSPVSLSMAVAGLGPIEGLDGVENYNVTDLVSGHLSYALATGTILEYVGFEDLDLFQVDKQVQEKDLMTERRNAIALMESMEQPRVSMEGDESPVEAFPRLDFADKFIEQRDRGHRRDSSRLSITSQTSQLSFKSGGSFVETVFDADRAFGGDETEEALPTVSPVKLSVSQATSEPWACQK